jgi:hypothetical protein
MKRLVKGALLAAGTALAISAAPAMPAAAATSGSETFSATIVFSGGTVISGVVVAKGVFSGVGRVVELPLSRWDLVFPGGTIHLISTLGSGPFTINPHNCLFSGTSALTWEVSGRALLVRNPDGSCSFTQAPLHEVDMDAVSGTLSF